MKRLNYLDNLKGFGIIMVIMGHMSLLPIGVNHLIYSFHMPLFFLISGYLYNPKNNSIYDEIKINFNRYIIPYFKIGLICFFIWGIVIKLLKKQDINIWDSLYSLLFNTYDKINCTPIWFLYTLFFSFIIFKFLLRFNYIFSIFILIILSYFLSNFESNFISINSFLASFYILLGYQSKFLNFNKKYLILVLIIIIILLVCFFGIPINQFMHNNFKPNIFIVSHFQ
jgi:acyltransferase